MRTYTCNLITEWQLCGTTITWTGKEWVIIVLVGWLGDRNLFAFHGGCDVIKGEKWIANNWITVDDNYEMQMLLHYKRIHEPQQVVLNIPPADVTEETKDPLRMMGHLHVMMTSLKGLTNQTMNHLKDTTSFNLKSVLRSVQFITYIILFTIHKLCHC
ncbi:hypothetical protein BSL78_05075 [Apostichopus japonicus]|uniref:Uncharacterized protein n=1 Tax=Stichopus japonicus TaxID=307972 RepID=A0A2G8LCN5_STIJA|nr:hypothetical protein BSL78_05075 [Apostichopus japonicus]